MIVYHGSTVIVQEPNIIINEIGRDFGFGFYNQIAFCSERALENLKYKGHFEG